VEELRRAVAASFLFMRFEIYRPRFASRQFISASTRSALEAPLNYALDAAHWSDPKLGERIMLWSRAPPDV
jgi:hypothetical protein